MKKFFLVMAVAALFFNACKKEEIQPEDDNQSELSGLVPAGWDIQLVDSAATGTDVADFNKIAVDKNKGVHILYSVDAQDDYSLKYAYKPAGGNWSIETLNQTENNFDLYNGADFGITNTEIYIVYTDAQANSQMHIVHKAIGSGSWQYEIFDGNSSARYPSVFVDVDNVVHIAYSHANYGQYYARYGDTGMQITTNGSYSHPDIVVDKDGVIHIFYADNNDLFSVYSTDNGANWIQNLIYNDDEIEKISATVDTAGNISVGFSMNQLDNNVDFLYKPYGNSNFSVSKTNINRVSRLQFELASDFAGRQYFTTYEYTDLYCLQFSEKDKASSVWKHTLLMKDDNYRYGSVSCVAADKDAGIHISANGASNEVSNKLYYLNRENF